MRTPDPDRLVDLCKPHSEGEAAVIVALLRDEGIPAIGPSSVSDPFGGALDLIVPFRVQVKACDLELARAFLEERKELASEIDWDSVEWAAPDDDERIVFEGGGSSIDKGLFIRVAAFLVILMLLVYLLTSVVNPGSADGIVPGGTP